MPHITNLAQKLKQAGHKLTQPRLAVIQVLESHPEHLDHTQILTAGRQYYPNLSRATVYRTMELLVDLNLVRPLYLNDPTQRFVSTVGGHHHLVCTACHQVTELEECPAEGMLDQLESKYGFQIHNHLLEFQGVCQNCSP